ncbi:hypothetical protein [Leuconostoc holzapfelii]|uniref:Uncharacterized protein n=1 Tax=Leuconostoc holzapfelii TaxID=434464 RepID=A0A846ZGX4_9LACO|nr:hypothetical protein [Leuconostoc holzapfelii]NKZ19099.1 hypothetical protein [Leuconostoc holzapfelii]
MKTPILMAIAPIQQANQNGVLLVDKQAKQAYFTAQQLPTAKAQKWLLWLLIFSSILVTPYWLFDRMLHLPHFPIHQPIIWWLVLALTLGLPIVAWYVGRQRAHYDFQRVTPLAVDQATLDQALKYWWFERLWVAFVLLLLPPTSVLFLVLYVIKSDPLDALLITVHATLFMRRLIPHAFSRIMVSKQAIQEWQNESRITTGNVSTSVN